MASNTPQQPQVVYSNLGGYAWQARPAMKEGPVLADVMTPSSVPVMLVRPGYRPELNLTAVIDSYMNRAAQMAQARPYRMPMPIMPKQQRIAGAAVGGSRPVGTQSANKQPDAPVYVNPGPKHSWTPMPSFEKDPSPRRIDPMEQTMRGPYYWNVPAGLGGIGTPNETPLGANGESFQEDEALTQGGTRPAGPALKDVTALYSMVPGAQAIRTAISNPAAAMQIGRRALEGAYPGGGFLSDILQRAYNALGL